jgi:hypothetical protein
MNGIGSGASDSEDAGSVGGMITDLHDESPQDRIVMGGAEILIWIKTNRLAAAMNSLRDGCDGAGERGECNCPQMRQLVR